MEVKWTEKECKRRRDGDAETVIFSRQPHEPNAKKSPQQLPEKNGGVGGFSGQITSDRRIASAKIKERGL